MDRVDGRRGQDLWERADRVLPGGGVYLTRSARFAGLDTLPGFIVSGDGCRVVDADGRTYIDFTCANGPNLLGYRHPEVEAAATHQAAMGDLLPFYNPAFVEFGERLLRLATGFVWTVMAKNGSDVTSLASRIARAATKRRKVVLFKHAYHGFAEEFALGHERVPSGGDVLRLPWNDPGALDEVAESHEDDIAALLLNPLDQNPGKPTRGPSTDFIAAISAFKERTGALLILDDIRSGFRMHPNGSHVAIGLAPDMVCLGKALANGYALSALVGHEDLRSAAQRIMFTASFTFSAVASRAGITTLDIYERDHVFAAMERAGQRLRHGLATSAANYGIGISQSGPVTQPTVLFEDDPQQEKLMRFARESALRGAIYHPRLNWFLSAAHDDASIDEALTIADEAFRVVAST